MAFSWRPATQNSIIKRTHFNEIQEAADVLAANLGIAAYTWTKFPISPDENITGGYPPQSQLEELRGALDYIHDNNSCATDYSNNNSSHNNDHDTSVWPDHDSSHLNDHDAAVWGDHDSSHLNDHDTSVWPDHDSNHLNDQNTNHNNDVNTSVNGTNNGTVYSTPRKTSDRRLKTEIVYL